MKKRILLFSFVILMIFISFKYFGKDPLKTHFEEWGIVQRNEESIISFKEKGSFTKGGLHYVVFIKDNLTEKYFDNYVKNSDNLKTISKVELLDTLKNLSNDNDFLFDRIYDQDIISVYIKEKDIYNFLILLKTEQEIIYVFIQI